MLLIRCYQLEDKTSSHECFGKLKLIDETTRKTGVNFTNVLWAAFMRADPKSAKKTVKLSSFIALLGSASVKAARRTLVELNPGVNFTNILRAAFTRADPKSAKKLLNLTVFFALLGSERVKAARRTLVKLTPDLFFSEINYWSSFTYHPGFNPI